MNEKRIRGLYILGAFSFVILFYIIRLFYLQVFSKEYAHKADVADLEDVVLLPSRGIIYDRMERIYVKNTPTFDLMFKPKEISIPDTSILVEYLGMTPEQIRHEIKKHRGIGRYQWQPLKKQIDKYTYNRFAEHLWQFDGISVVAKPTREFNYPAGAHFLGFINEVDTHDLNRSAKEDNYYRSGDLTGKTGVEKSYEKILRGVKGKKTILRDAFKREVGPYAEGKYDRMPIPGRDIKIGIDGELQVLGERLMQNKLGSIVAIEPSTGDILAFVSAPSYDPALLTGSDLGKNSMMLAKDSLNPLFNRPLMAKYPPGSIFKMLQALAAMSEGIVDINTHYRCVGAWFRNRGKPACHGAHGSCSLPIGIKQSCNAFFAETYYQFLTDPRYGDIHTAYEKWFSIMQGYGIGEKLGVDIPNEKRGNLPTAGYYDKVYRGSWSALTIYSNSIGQGEIEMTPLQMANSAAMIANRGYYYRPHFLQATEDDHGNWGKVDYEKIQAPGKQEHFQVVVDAMEQVVISGTARRAQVDSVTVCGKTGTVENKKGEDHSVFMAFAPKDNPQIAVAVIVENSGFGGTWAAPIASLMIEQYLKGSIKNERKLQRILDADFVHPEKKLIVQH